MRIARIYTYSIVLFFLACTVAFAQNDDKLHSENIKKVNDESGKTKNNPETNKYKFDLNMYQQAADGYDVVAYFADQRPEKGVKDYTYNWMGAVWQFSSQKHMDLFKENPEKYAPQFGGYGSYGISIDKLFHSDSELFTINNEKLYLFVNKEYKNKFLSNVDQNISKAEENWPNLRKITSAK